MTVVFSYSISKVSISFLTEVISSILQVLVTAKANPFSSMPFWALVKTAQIQYGELSTSQVLKLKINVLRSDDSLNEEFPGGAEQKL